MILALQSENPEQAEKLFKHVQELSSSLLHDFETITSEIERLDQNHINVFETLSEDNEQT